MEPHLSLNFVDTTTDTSREMDFTTSAAALRLMKRRRLD
jgi:hypothetical protein